MATPTAAEILAFVSVEQNCIDAVAAMKWPDGKPVCPDCNSTRNYWLDAQKRWKCAECGKQFSVRVGTIFEDSPLPLSKWLIAMWLVDNAKFNKVSTYTIAGILGITQKSAWNIRKKILSHKRRHTCYLPK